MAYEADKTLPIGTLIYVDAVFAYPITIFVKLYVKRHQSLILMLNS